MTDLQNIFRKCVDYFCLPLLVGIIAVATFIVSHALLSATIEIAPEQNIPILTIIIILISFWALGAAILAIFICLKRAWYGENK